MGGVITTVYLDQDHIFYLDNDSQKKDFNFVSLQINKQTDITAGVTAQNKVVNIY